MGSGTLEIQSAVASQLKLSPVADREEALPLTAMAAVMTNDCGGG